MSGAAHRNPDPGGPGAPAALWEDLLHPAERSRLEQAGFARRSGFGRRPAALVIDAQNYMVGPVGDEDLEYPSSCGATGRQALGRIRLVLDAARAAGAPVFFTRFELARDGSDMGVYRAKRDLLASEGWCLHGSVGARIADVVAPQATEMVLVKNKPSAFFGTPLLAMLVDRAVDSIVVMGGSTSNCVRATVVDAASYNLRVSVPADCVFDRIDVSHRVALFDIDRQYGDVVWADEVADRFSRIGTPA
ncbi:MAG: isochorismatase family protein [Streptosporangiaceae bacterium]